MEGDVVKEGKVLVDVEGRGQVTRESALLRMSSVAVVTPYMEVEGEHVAASKE